MRNARLDIQEQRLYVCDLILLDLETDVETEDCDLELVQSQLEYIVDVMNSLPLDYERLCDFLKGCIRVIKLMCIDHLNGIIDAARLHLNIISLLLHYFFRTLERLV